MSFVFFVGKGTGLCVVFGKRAFAGCISGNICCDNSSQFVTEVSIIGEVRDKLGRNFDIGILYIFVLVYTYILYNFCFCRFISSDDFRRW